MKNLILALLMTSASAQTLHLGQPVDNASSTSSILGQSTVTVTSTTCNTLTASGCSVSANGPYAKTLSFIGSPSGAVAATVAIAPGHEICAANSMGQALTIGGGSGTTVSIPSGTGVSGVAAICMVSPDGVNYVQSSGTSSGGAGTTQTSNGTGGFTASGNNTILNSLPVQEYKNSVNPPLFSWLSVLHACQFKQVNVVLLDDSKGIVYQGLSAEGPTNAWNRYAEQERLALQSTCPNGGTGIVPYYAFLAPGSPNPNGQYYGGTSGSCTQTNTIGPSMSPSAILTGPLGVVASCTTGTQINWTNSLVGTMIDHADMICLTGSGMGTWTLNAYVAGTTTPSIGTATCGGGSGSPAAQYVSTGAFTSQNVLVTAVCSGSCQMYGIGGTNGTAGVIFHNWSSASGVAELYSGSTAFAFMDALPNGINLVQTGFGTNEIPYGYTPTTFAAALQNIVTHEAGTTTNPSILITSPFSGSNGFVSSFPLLAAAALGVAQTNAHTDYVNLNDYAGTAVVPALLGSDSIHYSDEGSLDAGAIFNQKIQDISPSGGGTNAQIAAQTVGGQALNITNGAGGALALLQTNSIRGDIAGLQLRAVGSNGFTLAAYSSNTSGGAIANLHDDKNGISPWLVTPTDQFCLDVPDGGALSTCGGSGFIFTPGTGGLAISGAYSGLGAIISNSANGLTESQVQNTNSGSNAQAISVYTSDTGVLTIGSTSAANPAGQNYVNAAAGGPLKLQYQGTAELTVGPTNVASVLPVTAPSVMVSGIGTFSTLRTSSGVPWNYTPFSAAIDLNQGTTDTGPVRFQYGNYLNMGINVSASGVPSTCATSEAMRFIDNDGENSGAVIGAIDTNGNICGWNSMRATTFYETLTTPASSSAPCTVGQFTDDANYHYVCVAENTWKRAALSSF